MKIAENVLIVEDEEEWCEIYTDMARRHGIKTIRSANNLAEASRLLEDMKFAVAFVDIGLDVEDDENVDGLRVMERIRAAGDETSIIVITGRSGEDVLPITRDALKKYDAFDAVRKVPIAPSDILSLLDGGLNSYRREVESSRVRVSQILRGNLPAEVWDYQMLKATQIKGGPISLHNFLDELLEGFLPIVPRQKTAAAQMDPKVPVVYGEYWSRAIAAAVLVCFGDGEIIAQAEKEAGESSTFLGRFDVGEIVERKSAGSVRGLVFLLQGETREDFMKLSEEAGCG